MTARPLDQILPGRFAVAWISWRGRTLPRMKDRYQRARRALELAAIWLAALVLVLAYLAMCAWLDADDAQARAEESATTIAQLRLENAQLRAVIAEHAAATGRRNVFYVVEGESLDQAAAKLQRMAVNLAGEAFDMRYPKGDRK